MSDEGVLIIFSGPAGAGKDTVLKRLAEKRNDVKISVSMTTRPKRREETDGVHYFFVSREQFERSISDDKMLEHVEYAGHLYGTPKEPVDRALADGKALVLKIDVKGAEQVRKIYPEAISIFLMPPSVETLKQRLAGRNSEDEATRNRRLAIAGEELNRAGEYDYKVVNDSVENAVSGIEKIIKAKRRKSFCGKKTISEASGNV